MKKVFIICMLVVISVGTVFPSVIVSATEVRDDQTAVENVLLDSVNPNDDNIIVYQDSDGSIVVRKYEDENYNSKSLTARASSTYISKWGQWNYLNFAVTTGVAAGAINSAFYGGGSVAISMFGIPGWAIAGLVGVANWTEFGSAPGKAIANKWDKNKNGWVGFYMRRGYNSLGKHVATEYKTK